MSGKTRRDFLLVTIGLWQAASLRAQQKHDAATKTNTRELATFLSSDQRQVLRRLMDRIVPGDNRSTGALGAKVDEYIDFVLLHADPVLQETWWRGLDRYGEAIAGKGADAIDEFLSEQAEREFSPSTEEEKFFVYLKTAVTEGFYTSEEGISNELRYKGMAFQLDFPGCTHAEHKVPSGYRPLLRSFEKA